MRMKQGQYTYYMRCWLSYMQCSWSCHHYPLPISMLHPGDVDHNTMVYTRVNITDILHDITKWISKLTHPNLKQNKKNHTYTLLNILSVKMIIKPTPFFVLSRSIALIENSTQRSIRKSRITGTNQFA